MKKISFVLFESKTHGYQVIVRDEMSRGKQKLKNWNKITSLIAGKTDRLMAELYQRKSYRQESNWA